MTPTAANSNDAPAFVIRLEAEIDALLTMIVIEGVAAVDATALSKLIELAITASCPAIAEEAKRLAKQLSSISTVASGSGAQAKELSHRYRHRLCCQHRGHRPCFRRMRSCCRTSSSKRGNI